MENYNCEKCGTSFERPTKGYKKRFCSRACANSRQFNETANKKRAKSNRQAWKKMAPDVLKERKKNMHLIVKKRMQTYQNNFMAADFDTLASGTKRRRVLLEQNNCCLHCGLKEWQGQPLTLELDHIDGNNQNEVRDNLRYLCPNCHSLTPTWRGRNNTGDKNSRRKNNGPVV